MKPFQTFVLLIFCFFLSNGSFAQSDTACVSKRWIAVKNIEQNSALYDSSMSILNEIKKLAESNKIQLYSKECYGYDQSKWYPIPVVKKDSNYIDYYDYLVEDYSVFTMRIQSDIPLVDEYGDPIVETMPDGAQYFVYDDPEIYHIRIGDIREVRIREERTFNAESGLFEGEFRPTGISFYIRNNFQSSELFWVDLNQLFEKTSNPEEFPWYSFLKEKAYSGFQYMQISCYDDKIRY